MTAIALAALCLTASAEPQSVADRAAVMAARGDGAGARRLLSPKVSPSNTAALFVLAAIELEEGHFARASELVAGLNTPEVRVLAKLIEERRRTPGDRWTDVAARAWVAAGRPAPPTKALLSAIEVQRPIDPAAIRTIRDAGTVFLLSFAESRNGYTDLLQAAQKHAEAADGPLGIQLVALRVLLDERLPQEQRARARSTARALLNRFAADENANGYLALGSTLFSFDSPDPLIPSELTALERAIRRPVFELPVRALYDAFKGAYQQVEPGQAHARAFGEAGGGVPLDFHVALSSGHDGSRLASSSRGRLESRGSPTGNRTHFPRSNDRHWASDPGGGVALRSGRSRGSEKPARSLEVPDLLRECLLDIPVAHPLPPSRPLRPKCGGRSRRLPVPGEVANC